MPVLHTPEKGLNGIVLNSIVEKIKVKIKWIFIT